MHPLADKAQSTSTTIALLLCTEFHPEPLRSLYSVTIIPGGRGLFPDLVGQFFLGSPTEFRIRQSTF